MLLKTSSVGIVGWLVTRCSAAKYAIAANTITPAMSMNAHRIAQQRNRRWASRQRQRNPE